MPRLGPVTRAVLATWVALWVVSFLSALAGPGLSALAALDSTGLLRGEWLRLPGVLAYTLVHDPYGILHLLFNALVFFWVAPEVETLWPGRKFVLLLVSAALAGAAANLVLVAFGPTAFGGLVYGGSGLVFAVMAAHAAIYPGRRVSLLLFQCRLIHLFLVLCGLDLLWLIADLAGRVDGVAQDVHLAGAATGWIWAGGFWRHGAGPPGRGLAERLRGWRAARRARRSVVEEAELDRLLAKIGREGMGSLSRDERDFLTRRSQRKK